MKHKDKVKLATTMNRGVRSNCFISDAWLKRKRAIALRIAYKNNKDKPLSWFRQHA